MNSRHSLCVVFDLDDTLYQERDYQLSGFRAVAEYCRLIYGRDLLREILLWDQSGELDVFEQVCVELGVPASCKESFIWVYRNHLPDISLSERAAGVLNRIQDLVTSVAVLTDGRSTTQRLKLKALGLSSLPAFISEEWGDSKPGKARFEAIQRQFKADGYWYVGDNPKKDFLAPNELGWHTVGLRGGEHNVHSQDTSRLSEAYLPQIWVDRLDQLIDEI
jgi:putative hydrolase of the HAD superfamily